MLGGHLIGSGNNTCVYRPAVDCIDGSEIPANHVSRIVHPDSVEPDVQGRIKAAMSNMKPKYLKHFNLATKICAAKFKAEDLTNGCSVEALQGMVKLGATNMINMITPSQESDINNKEDDKLYKPVHITNAAFKDFLHALVEMNSYSVQVFHTDAHVGNVSWKGSNIVLHDWEKCQIGDENLLASINGSKPTSWNLLGYSVNSRERRYLYEYPCWKYPLLAMTIFDSYSGFPPSHDTLHLAHQIYFRFWDTLSIGLPLRQMYHIADVTEPEYINRIMETVINYFFDIFMAEFKTYPQVVLSEDDKKTKLNGITDRIHELIDAAFIDENNKFAVNAELLKLVAKHAHNSPSKKVLLNMLPKVSNGGRSTRRKRYNKTFRRRSKRTAKYNYLR